MNYHLKDNNGTIHAFEKKEEPLIETGYSRVENYFLYKGLDRFSKKPTEYEYYARIYLRVDNKLIEIQRKYQDILEFYADTSSLLVSFFQILLFFFNIFNNFKGEYSITQKLFFFDENKHTENDIKRHISFSNTNKNENNEIIRIRVNNLNTNEGNQQQIMQNSNINSDNSINNSNLKKKKINIFVVQFLRKDHTFI